MQAVDTHTHMLLNVMYHYKQIRQSCHVPYQLYLCLLYCGYLLCDDREYFNVDSVEFIEARPSTRATRHFQ